MAQRTGTRFTHIPYQGGPATITAVLRGDVDFIVETGTVIKSQAAAGLIDILAVSSRERWMHAPNVPTRNGGPGIPFPGGSLADLSWRGRHGRRF